jgi:hypothetical protein
MKDFYDLHVLASFSAFEGTALVRAVQATFTRRGTALPTDEPVALSRAFLSAPTRQTQWRAFLRRARLEAPADGGDLSDLLRHFLVPVLTAAATGQMLSSHWPAGGPWETPA